MDKKLISILTACALASGVAYAGDTGSVMYKKEERKLSCSFTLTGSEKQYFISSGSLSDMKKESILFCLGKAARQQPVPVKDEEILVHALAYAKVGELRCYKGKKFILKFRGDIPGDLEKLIDVCFIRAAYELRERMESNDWT